MQAAADERAREGGQEQVAHGPIVAAAGVRSQDDVPLPVEHRPGQALDPVIGRGGDVGLEHEQSAGADPAGHHARRAQGEVSPRHPVKGHAGELARRRRVAEAHHGQPDPLAAGERLIGGAGVDVDEQRRKTREVLVQSVPHRRGHVRHRRRILERQQRHRQLARRERLELARTSGGRVVAVDSRHLRPWLRGGPGASAPRPRGEP